MSTTRTIATLAGLALVASGAAIAPASSSEPIAPSEVSVGAGGYTTEPVGALPSGCGDISTNPRRYLTDDAPSGPVPTNDWWSSLAFKRIDCQYSVPLHAHPASYQPGPAGLGISYTTTPALSGTPDGVAEYHFPYTEDLVAGVVGLDATETQVDDWSDWTVTPYWSDGTRSLRATIGHGLPFAWFETSGGPARLAASAPAQVWWDDGSRLGLTVNGHDYLAVAPSGTDWVDGGDGFTADVGTTGYFSVAVLPTDDGTDPADRQALAEEYADVAHAAVVDSTVSYDYAEASAEVRATYSVTTQAREGNAEGTVLAAYPHQARRLSGADPLEATYVSPRGPLTVLTDTSSFTTVDTFQGVLPEVPAVATNSGADRATLDALLAEVAGDPMAAQGNDTYWTGKGLGRAARIAEIADQLGATDIRDSALDAIRSTLTEWFTPSEGKTEKIFYYDENWGTLIGYPASFGSDEELNDHHFHYGYFIAAAATLAKFDPEWAAPDQYGGMVDMLIRDANGPRRDDDMFPYLRDFDIYAGHDWASGHGSFGAGNNQESSSEGMNFATAMIEWGEVTGDTALRDAGVFLYTTQAAAIQEYWLNAHGTAFPNGFDHETIGMVWGDGGAYSTWFSPEAEMIHGINMLPITGGHLYLGYSPETVTRNYNHMEAVNGGPPTVWQDILWSFRALADADTALADWRATSFDPEEGESRAHTFHWIANLAALGQVDTDVSADHPLAAVFTDDGARTYVASNPTADPLPVTFSDGTTLSVDPGQTATTGAHTWSGGSATGGTPDPDPDPDPEPDPTDPPSSEATRYLTADGGLAGTAGADVPVTLASADGANYDGTPHQPAVFSATDITGTYDGGATTFDLAVDAGTTVGLATQIRVSYDRTGDGTWDRVETFHYFATDPISGSEHYTVASGLQSTSGQHGNLDGGTVRVEVWSPIGTGSPTVNVGSASTVTFPIE